MYNYILYIRLRPYFKKFDEFLGKNKKRILLQVVLIEIVLITNLVFVWFQNKWWYENAIMWSGFIAADNVFSMLIPVACFSYTVHKNIAALMRKKKML